MQGSQECGNSWIKDILKETTVSVTMTKGTHGLVDLLRISCVQKLAEAYFQRWSDTGGQDFVTYR